MENNENKIWCSECETYITEHDSCECGTTMREALEIAQAEGELDGAWAEGDACD